MSSILGQYLNNARGPAVPLRKQESVSDCLEQYLESASSRYFGDKANATSNDTPGPVAQPAPLSDDDAVAAINAFLNVGGMTV